MSSKEKKGKGLKVPEVWFVCTECGETVAWNNFNDGTPTCTTCDIDMVVDMSMYKGGY